MILADGMFTIDVAAVIIASIKGHLGSFQTQMFELAVKLLLH